MGIFLPQCALSECHYANLHTGIHYCIKIGSFLTYFSIEESFRPLHAKARVWSRKGILAEAVGGNTVGEHVLPNTSTHLVPEYFCPILEQIVLKVE